MNYAEPGRLGDVSLAPDGRRIRMAIQKDSVSISNLMRAIERLPSDKPVMDPKKWYKTQKEHWLGWLREYHGPSAYGRKNGRRRDAKFAYNHIVEPKMLVWLV